MVRRRSLTRVGLPLKTASCQMSTSGRQLTSLFRVGIKHFHRSSFKLTVVVTASYVLSLPCTGWPRNFCPCLCQVLTDFQNFSLAHSVENL